MNYVRIFKFFMVKNLYLIYVLLKNSNIFERFLKYSTHFCTISLKNKKQLT